MPSRVPRGPRRRASQESPRTRSAAGRRAANPPSSALEVLQARLDQLVERERLHRWTLALDGVHPIDALALRAGSTPSALRVLVTAGVHGNELCGCEAALTLPEVLTRDPAAAAGVDLTLVPLLNPASLARGTRRTAAGVDLNRAFLDEEDALPGVLAVRALLADRGFDLALDLHRGGVHRSGFWVLQHGAQDLMARAMQRLAADWPVLQGSARPYRMVAPGVGASGQQATLKNYLARHGVPRTATLEAPGSLPHAQQVQGLVALSLLILDEARRLG